MKRRTTSKDIAIHAALVAPCGMDCGLCRAYSRERKPCPGCRSNDGTKSNSCRSCAIKNCRKLVGQGFTFCFSCGEFPCIRLEHLDKRYRSKYGMSMIENLSRIRESGIRRFVRNENDKWRCHQCGATLCVHKPQCRSCGSTWPRMDVEELPLRGHRAARH